MIEVYQPLFRNKKPIIQTDISTAEMVKYASNAFLALKISYINEVANLSEACASKIKANVLLTRVGALYHDIGKIKIPTI